MATGCTSTKVGAFFQGQPRLFARQMHVIAAPKEGADLKLLTLDLVKIGVVIITSMETHALARNMLV